MALSVSFNTEMSLSTPVRYEAITWKDTEGNIIYRDSWNDRCCAC